MKSPQPGSAALRRRCSPPRQGGLLTRDFDLDRFRMTHLPKIFVWTLCTPFTAFTNAEANAVSDRLLVRLKTRLV